MVQLGDRVRDKISGFEGIVQGYTMWIYGCTIIDVQPEKLEKGLPVSSMSFDIEQLEVVTTGVLISQEYKKSEPLMLGNSVRDKITGFRGIVIGLSQRLYSSSRIYVQSESLYEGSPIPFVSMDLYQAFTLEHGKIPAWKVGSQKKLDTSFEQTDPPNSGHNRSRAINRKHEQIKQEALKRVDDLAVDVIDLQSKPFDFDDCSDKTWEIVYPSDETIAEHGNYTSFDDALDTEDDFCQPKVNYIWPLPEHKKHTTSDIIYLANCYMTVVSVIEEDKQYLAPTSRGQDMAWYIAETYVALGLLPPVHLGALPNMASKEYTLETVIVIEALKKSHRIIECWCKADITSLDMLAAHFSWKE